MCNRMKTCPRFLTFYRIHQCIRICITFVCILSVDGSNSSTVHFSKTIRYILEKSTLDTYIIIIIQPTQNIGNSSPFNALVCAKLCITKNGKIYNNQAVLKHTNYMEINITNATIEKAMDNYKSDVIYNSDSQGCKSMEDKFPWLKKFSKIMCTAIGNKSYQLLERFVLLYVQFMTKSIKECSNNVSEIIQLRNHMRNTLTFFHFYWKSIKQNYSDHSSYLNNMSQLLGIYLNIELRISKNKRSTSKISAKLLSMLWIFLDESKEHVFRALLRINPILKKYSKICDPIFMKCFTSLMTYPETTGDVAYVRYLLIFKIWKSMKKDVEQKKKINEMALAKLGPCIPKLQPNLMECIPQPSVDCKNETRWLLQFNVFNIHEACEKFLLFEEGRSRVVSPRDFPIVKTLTDYSDMQTSLTQEGGCANKQISCSSTLYKVKNSTSNNRNSINENRNTNFSKKGHKFRNSVLGADPEEIILIDLTEEDTDKLQKKMEGKKSKRKLEWLHLVRKKNKMQKSINNVAGIVDVHSIENVQNKPDNTLSQFSPIFDDNIWNNTQCLITTDKEQMKDKSCSSCSTSMCNSVQKNEDLLNISKMQSEILKCKICDFCNEYTKQDGTPHLRVAHLVKILKLVIQIFSGKLNDSQLLLNLERDNRDEDCVSSQTSLFENRAKQSCHNAHCREELFTEEKVSTNTTSVVTMCQNCQTQIQGLKHEALIKEDSDETHFTENVYKDALFDLQNFENHLQNIPLNINNCQTQANTVQEELLPNSTKCEHCYEENNVTAFRCQKHTAYCNTENKGYTCDKHIVSNTCNAFNECVNALNRICQLILSICTEKHQTDLLKPKSDIYSMLATILGDKVMKSLLADSIHDMNSTLVDKLRKTLEISGVVEFFKSSRCGTGFESSTPDVATIVKKDCEQQTVVSTSHPDPEDFKETPHLKLANSNSAENVLYSNTKLEYETKCKCKGSSYNKTLLNQEKESQVNDEYKNLVSSTQANFADRMLSDDEFKDIDILDSILNGGMDIENEHDILEDTESSLISSGSNDNSANVLNCITNFIEESEDNYISGETDLLNVKSDAVVSIKSLPEGSLGTTGILNSLLDFDLIPMDIASNDFMYSNIQTVNPRVIKKNLEKDFLETNKFNDTGTYQCETKDSSFVTSDAEDFLIKKKDESCVNQKDLVDSSVDIVGFGLNPSEPDVFDLPPLEDEESMLGNRNVSSSCGSPLLINTDIIPPELKETSSKYTSISPIHDLSSDVMIEQPYMYVKEDPTNPSSQVPKLKMDVEHGRSACSLQEDLLEDTNMIYQLPSKCKSQQLRRKSHLKERRRCSVREMSTGDPNLSVTNSGCTGEIGSKSILMKPKVRWFIRSVNIQTPLYLKKQIIKKSTNLLFNNEELPMKKREVASKLLPLSKSDLTSPSKQASNSIMNANYQKRTHKTRTYHGFGAN